MLSENVPFGKPSPRQIPNEYFAGWPMDSSAFCAYMHYATLEFTCDPQFHAMAFFAIATLELARHGYKSPFHLPISAILCGEGGSGKSVAMRIALDFLRDLWAQDEDLSYSIGNSPIIHCSGSIQGVLYEMNQHYNEQIDSTPTLLYADYATQLFTDRNSIYPYLSALLDGQSLEVNLREVQRIKAQKKRNSRNKIDSHVINPHMSMITAVDPIKIGESFGATTLKSGFLKRSFTILGCPPRAEYFEFYIRDRYQQEKVDAIDAFRQWFICLDLTTPYDQNKLIKYEPKLLTPLHPTAGQEREDFFRAREKQRCTLQLSALYALLRQKPWVESVSFTRAYAQVTCCVDSITTLERYMDASEITLLANKAEEKLERRVNGISRRKLFGYLKTDPKKFNEVIVSLKERGTIVISSGLSSSSNQIFYHVDHAPEQESPYFMGHSKYEVSE